MESIFWPSLFPSHFPPPTECDRRTFRLKLLVATDVAARGLDIKGVGSLKEEKNGHQNSCLDVPGS